MKQRKKEIKYYTNFWLLSFGNLFILITIALISLILINKGVWFLSVPLLFLSYRVFYRGKKSILYFTEKDICVYELFQPKEIVKFDSIKEIRYGSSDFLSVNLIIEYETFGYEKRAIYTVALGKDIKKLIVFLQERIDREKMNIDKNRTII